MNKTVVYTAIFGGYDQLREPACVPPGCDFVCFTDTPLSSRTWDIRVIEPTETDATRNARKCKVLAHSYVSAYEQSIWIDGNILVRGDVNVLLQKYLTQHTMAVYDHMHVAQGPRDCIYDEAQFLIDTARQGKRKDDPVLMQKQIDHYRREGYPAHHGLLSSMVMLRRHNAPEVIETMEAWWSEIQTYSKRDQLSFNYVAWKHKLDFIYIPEDSRDNEYFLWVPHARHITFRTKLRLYYELVRNKLFFSI